MLSKLEINSLESEDKPILDKLLEIIRDQYIKENNSRIIIFVDLRKAATQLCEYLSTNQAVVSSFGKN